MVRRREVDRPLQKWRQTTDRLIIRALYKQRVLPAVCPSNRDRRYNDSCSIPFVRRRRRRSRSRRRNPEMVSGRHFVFSWPRPELSSVRSNYAWKDELGLFRRRLSESAGASQRRYFNKVVCLQRRAIIKEEEPTGNGCNLQTVWLQEHIPKTHSIYILYIIYIIFLWGEALHTVVVHIKAETRKSMFRVYAWCSAKVQSNFLNHSYFKSSMCTI